MAAFVQHQQDDRRGSAPAARSFRLEGERPTSPLTALDVLAERANASPGLAETMALRSQADARAASSQASAVQAVFDTAQRQENRTGLSDQLKAGLESLSGFDLSDVRVHRNSPKPAQLNAHAYTQGKDIHVASGQEKHLPHEGWHAVQQMQGRVRPTADVSGVAVNDDVRLETEADVMGSRAAQMRAED